MEINKVKRGVNVNDVSPAKFIKRLADFFREKDIIKVPKWGIFVKCCKSNELAPIQKDWFYMKAGNSIIQLQLLEESTFPRARQWVLDL